MTIFLLSVFAVRKYGVLFFLFEKVFIEGTVTAKVLYRPESEERRKTG
jgi:hypothetical protein